MKVFKHKAMKSLTFIFLILISSVIIAQNFEFEKSKAFPFGQPNPEAPKQIKDFDPMIGNCSCKSVTRINQNEWADTVQMWWTFKYIMNGMAIQDETWKADGTYSGSIRQYNADSSKWYVHYYSSSAAVNTLPAWEGNKQEDGKIVLYRNQTAPNGVDGYFRLTFSDISSEGYNWIGEWVDLAESFSYPTWKIFCRKEG